MDKLQIFITSLSISGLLITFYSIVGYISTFKTKTKYRLFDFENIFYGVIITVGLYALIKSQFIVNSITMTLIPIVVSLRLMNKKIEENNGNKYLPTFLCLILFIFNFSLYFKSTYVNTGYGDHSFYHLITSNIYLFGKESVDCAHNELPFSCGIYHYWDLWHQSMAYEIGLTFKLNSFEAYVLVHKIVLSLIIFIGAQKIIEQYNLHNIKFIVIIIFIILGINNEFNILIHPKQFITFATTILIIYKFQETKNIDIPLLVFILFTNLFYSPLSGITLVATIAAYRTIKNIKTIKSTIILLIISVTLFILLYQFVYQNPIQNIGEITWEINKFIRHFIFYNIYHSFLSNWPIMLIITMVLIFKKDFKLINSFELHITVLILLFGSFFSSILFFWKEHFQFMLNFQFALTILFIKFLSKTKIDNPKLTIITTYFMSLFAIFQFYTYQKLRYYTPFKIDNKNYFSLRLRAKEKLLCVSDSQETINVRQVNEEDFLFSIENKVLKHKPYNPASKLTSQ